ncbi:hypothetical protein NIIDMKKI_02580 [Mycobacterium kansasii]|uniref:FAS1 domain-containing protein n=1 Tax=Mycobacterium kansasii TaxID=1768 RepID=A0A7G1I5P0_MYCKA|nr:hypothetical protein NIIDMKKI_02580 [Mycobacterium kansasii]
MAAPASTTGMADPAADLIGTGCPEYAKQNPSGPGSVAGMAQDPVATAASNNPMLTTLTSALSGKLNPNVNLVDTLNSGQYTVFAPTNAAFDKLPAATIDQLKTDSALLSSILTYHVVQGQASPSKIDGTHTTLQGQRDRDRSGQRPQGQRCRAGMRRRSHRQRDRVHDRHGPDAAEPVISATRESPASAGLSSWCAWPIRSWVGTEYQTC